MNGLLVVNHFLKGEKFNELHSHLLNTAKNMGFDMKLETNLTLATKSAGADFVLFWDKDVNLAKRLENEGVRVFNSANSIMKCDDKARTYAELLGKVKQPKTIASPLTFFDEDLSDFVEEAVSILGLPVVLKDCFGSFGAQVHLCNTIDEVMAHIKGQPFILQQFIGSSAGRDKRLEVVGGEVICAVKRENADDFRSNVTNGGTMTICTPSDDEISTAIEACEVLGLTFGGVDILDNGDVCEVNSNAHIINIMKASGIDIAPKIYEEIIKQITE